MEHQLIELYCLICRIYDNHLVLKYQRLSNFKPKFSDEELLTCYFFGLMQKHTQQRAIYDYILQHWQSWFPALPSYQAFNRRLNNLSPAFEIIIEELLVDKLHLTDLTAASLRSWSRFVFSVKQPLESFFRWLIVKTDLQNASRVRSSNGFLIHCFGKLAFACLLVCFYS